MSWINYVEKYETRQHGLNFDPRNWTVGLAWEAWSWQFSIGPFVWAGDR